MIAPEYSVICHACGDLQQFDSPAQRDTYAAQHVCPELAVPVVFDRCVALIDTVHLNAPQ